MRIFKRLASVHVDHSVGVVCAAVLSSDEVPSGSRITDPVPGEKRGGWAMVMVFAAI